MGWQDVKEFTVVRPMWARGGQNGEALLKNEDGAMCCLGFYGKACGATEGELLGSSSPALFNEHRRKGIFPPWMVQQLTEYFSENLRDCKNLMEYNDECRYTDYVREQRISEIFEKHGVTVRFVNSEEP